MTIIFILILFLRAPISNEAAEEAAKKKFGKIWLKSQK